MNIPRGVGGEVGQKIAWESDISNARESVFRYIKRERERVSLGFPTRRGELKVEKFEVLSIRMKQCFFCLMICVLKKVIKLRERKK